MPHASKKDLPKALTLVRLLATVLALFSSMLWPARADAEEAEPALVLDWTAPASCPNGEAVRAQVLRLAALDERFAHRLEARGTIETDGQTWRLVLTTRFENTTGERRLSASSCSALTDAAVVVMALILNPESEMKPHGSAAPVPARASRSLRVRGLVEGHAGLHAGVAGAAGFELGAGVGVSLAPASFRIYANYAPPLEVHLSGSSGPGARLWFVSVGGAGCWEFGSKLFVGPCSGVAFTRLAGEGTDVATPQSAVTRWVSAVFGLTLGVRASRVVSLKAAGQALVPLHRPTLYFEDLGPVQRPAPVGGEAWVGAELAWP
jgi:hypothetical protein